MPNPLLAVYIPEVFGKGILIQLFCRLQSFIRLLGCSVGLNLLSLYLVGNITRKVAVLRPKRILPFRKFCGWALNSGLRLAGC